MKNAEKAERAIEWLQLMLFPLGRYYQIKRMGADGCGGYCALALLKSPLLPSNNRIIFMRAHATAGLVSADRVLELDSYVEGDHIRLAKTLIKQPYKFFTLPVAIRIHIHYSRWLNPKYSPVWRFIRRFTWL